MFACRHSSRPTAPAAAALIALAVAATALHEPAHGEWAAEIATGPFRLRSEFALSAGERRDLQVLIEQLRSDVEHTLQVDASGSPIEIHVFRSKRSYQQYLAQRVPDGVSRPALFVQGTDAGRVYIYHRWGYETDLRHECTHAVLHSTHPYLPLWLDEGLAEYFEIPAQDRARGNAYWGSVKRSAFFGRLPNLTALESCTGLHDMDGDEYRDSWVWVHFLLHGPLEVRQVLSDYLYDVREGNPAGRFSERLYARVPQTQDLFVQHLRTWK